MNSIAHAYSVVAFLLILGGTLIGFPMSVFSQVETNDEQAAQDSASTAVATETDSAAVIIDNYPRENLPGKEVYSDFVVGPGKFSLEIAPGESKIVEMVVSNRMGETKRFSFETEDMTGSENPAEAVVLLGEARGPYTLKDYIKIPYRQFDLKHGERARIPVTVSLPPDAEPGGRYGSLVVSIVSNPVTINETSGAKPGSAIISRIGTLFFVTTPGEIEQSGELTSFETIGNKKFFSKGPIPFGIVIENKGSVHLTPYGEVRLYNMSGNEVGFIELDPWFAMPKSLRLREVSWDRDFLLGRYTAVAKINRGYGNIVDEKSFTFWVVPYDLLAGVFVGLFVFFLVLYFILTRFELKKKAR